MKRILYISQNEKSCFFYPGRPWTASYQYLQGMSEEQFQLFLEQGYYKQGQRFYTPVCLHCQDCIGVRVPLAEFTMSKRQRQILRLNEDVDLTIGPPQFSAERFALYRRYHQKRWGYDVENPATYLNHMVRTWTGSVEFTYRLGEQILGFGIVDVTSKSANSAYFVYEAEKKRALGMYSLLREMVWAKECQKDFLYLGPWVASASCVQYKLNLRPYELKTRNGGWVRYDSPPTENPAETLRVSSRE